MTHYESSAADLGSVDKKDARCERERQDKRKNRARNANCVPAQPGKRQQKRCFSFHCKDVNPCKTQDFKTNKIGMYFKICYLQG